MNTAINKVFYNKHWNSSRYFSPHHWGYWEYIRSLHAQNCLEIGAGVRPRIPVRGNYFVDISKVSLKKLRDLGGNVVESDLQTRLPLQNDIFDLVCCFETLEHVPNDRFLLMEISRVLKKNGHALISFPINKNRWTEYDKTVGHYRRYEIEDINELFRQSNLLIIKYSILQTAWPGKLTGKALSILQPWCYPIFSKLTDILDSSPDSALRKPVAYKPVSEMASQKISPSDTTITLVCVKVTGNKV